jgi:hypothetical protein
MTTSLAQLSKSAVELLTVKFAMMGIAMWYNGCSQNGDMYLKRRFTGTKSETLHM